MIFHDQGVVGSGISIFAQSWIIQKRGPVFSAMFNPLNTVIVTFFASIFLKEQIYVGRYVEIVINHKPFLSKFTGFVEHKTL